MRALVGVLLALLALGRLLAGAPSTVAVPAPPGSVAAPPAGAQPRTASTPTTSIGGRELVVVSAGSYGTSYATLTAYTLSGSHWVRVYGPWTARIGWNGFAAPGAKREGDGRTPSGSFGFGFFFGVLPNPGVRFGYRRAYSYDVWDDDPASRLYNEWVDTREANPGRSPEPMDQVPAYDNGAVIAYNTARTPGAGSAIFLHQSTNSSTAGCVSLPRSELLDVLRWLDPRRVPRIVLGVGVRP